MEFGGYNTLDKAGKEYYTEEKYPNLIRFNAARYAMVYAVKCAGFSKVWIPFYLCKSVYDAFVKYNIVCHFYSLDENNEPDISMIEPDEAIVIVNYFGLKNDNYYDECCSKYKNVIFDNTQAFFAKPIMKRNVYNVYSPRKFVGVSDGAYLISLELEYMKSYDEMNIEIDMSGERACHIFKAIEGSVNSYYYDSLKAEKEIEESGIKYMSVLTRQMLDLVDYDYIKNARISNFRILEKNFNEINILKPKYNDGCPMVYPLLIENGHKIRQELVKRKVFVPQWWKWILEDELVNNSINSTEKRLALDLVPVPVDQRINEESMCTLIDIIGDVIGKHRG
ncbi:hypothetical protein NXH64_04745 [Butyrivibrio fibrisolvens]|uniref:hypothetical protein n=1 Tax=Pseudobutyrivibrio ruminis TaxID=46206 RepID=UPI0004135356|nr:hypothetical protein [Pseudobutyrivibrio ruminis]MDC7278809.1 hypothetical protein [Butyrivibrio fibrisolvens]